MGKVIEDEITSALATLPEWRLEAGRLVSERGFAGFAAAMVFVNAVASLAEQMDHHPDIDIRYNKVRLALISHDVDGLTARDLRFAKRLQESEAGAA